MIEGEQEGGQAKPGGSLRWRQPQGDPMGSSAVTCTSVGPPRGQGRAGTRVRQVRYPWYTCKEVSILEEPEKAGLHCTCPGGRLGN